MKKIENWKELHETVGEVVNFKNILDAIKAGPQIVKILKVEDVVEKEYLKIAFEIHEGPQKNIIHEAFEDDNREDKKWPHLGMLYKSYKKSAERFFTAFITSVEKSNADFKWDFDEKKLVGKLFVVNYGEEEYISEDIDDNNNAVIKMSMKIQEVRSIPALKDNKIEIKEPKVLTLKTGQTRTPVYNNESSTADNDEFYESSKQLAAEEDLPF